MLLPGIRYLFRGFIICMILKYVQILVGKQEQLSICIFQHPPLDRVDVVAAVSVTALLVCTKINVVCLSAADICGGSAVYKLDRLSCICSCRKRRCRHKSYNKADCKQ